MNYRPFPRYTTLDMERAKQDLNREFERSTTPVMDAAGIPEHYARGGVAYLSEQELWDTFKPILNGSTPSFAPANHSTPGLSRYDAEIMVRSRLEKKRQEEAPELSLKEFLEKKLTQTRSGSNLPA